LARGAAHLPQALPRRPEGRRRRPGLRARRHLLRRGRVRSRGARQAPPLLRTHGPPVEAEAPRGRRLEVPHQGATVAADTGVAAPGTAAAGAVGAGTTAGGATGAAVGSAETEGTPPSPPMPAMTPASPAQGWGIGVIDPSPAIATAVPSGPSEA